ncbi:MAG: hypothetical protein WC529_08025 [Candidatus Margulisiibacteriota bacterium]
MSVKKKKNSQKRIIGELKNQLMIQADRLGIREDYGPLSLEEMKLDAVGKIMGDFYAERSNLEYELNMLDSNKRDLLIKLERLNSYIRKAVSVREQHSAKMEQLIEKGMGDLQRTRRAVRKLETVSIKVAA